MKTNTTPIIALTCIVINYLSTYFINSIKFANIEIIGIFNSFGRISNCNVSNFFYSKSKTTVNLINPEEVSTLVAIS